MRLDFFFEDIIIRKRKLLAISILLASTFSWFFALDFLIQARITQGSQWLSLSLIESAAFLASTIISMVIGSSVSEKVSRRSLLSATIIIGVALAPLLLVVQGLFAELFVLSLLGASLGLGIPSCLAFLAESTTINERGRVSGISIAISFVLVFASVAAILLFGFGALALLIISIFRLSGFAGLLIDSCEKTERKVVSWRSILLYRNFLLYILPWLMVSLADGLKALIMGNFSNLPNYRNLDTFGYYFRYVCVGFSGLLAGVIADRFGRRQPIILGTVLMGVSYTFLSFVSSTSLILYLVVSGVAWSFLFTFYIVVLGDVAFSGAKERFYAVGVVIPLMGMVSSYLLSAALGTRTFLSQILSPFLSILIFISIVPIIYATETLPQSKAVTRKLKKQIEEIEKILEESKKTSNS